MLLLPLLLAHHHAGLAGEVRLLAGGDLPGHELHRGDRLVVEAPPGKAVRAHGVHELRQAAGGHDVGHSLVEVLHHHLGPLLAVGGGVVAVDRHVAGELGRVEVRDGAFGRAQVEVCLGQWLGAELAVGGAGGLVACGG